MRAKVKSKSETESEYFKERVWTLETKYCILLFGK